LFAVEVDGVLERKIHKLEVPALDSLAFWAADSPFSKSPVLNSDGGSFAVSVAGTLDVAPYKATIHWAAIEFDDDVLAAAGGAAGLTVGRCRLTPN